MRIAVQLFAKARDLAGASRVELNLPDAARVADVRVALRQRFPQMEPLISSLLVSVGTEYANDQTPLRVGADVACFPPVSGG
ncbi:MAG: MoaD/ThiS family protein [Planctomycetales bacterium]|nr:MoaD/ThiS family protein [Planctomycetales bacterium]